MRGGGTIDDDDYRAESAVAGLDEAIVHAIVAMDDATLVDGQPVWRVWQPEAMAKAISSQVRAEYARLSSSDTGGRYCAECGCEMLTAHPHARLSSSDTEEVGS